LTTRIRNSSRQIPSITMMIGMDFRFRISDFGFRISDFGLRIADC
jgi:hypothetical protein